MVGDGAQDLLRTLIKRVDDMKASVDGLTHKVFETRETVRINTETMQGLCLRMIEVERVVGDIADAIDKDDDGRLVAALNRFSDTMESARKDNR